MSYQKKYWYQFTSEDWKVNIVEFWHDTEATLTAEEVKALDVPFITEMPGIDHKFQPVRGTGCEINLLSTTDGKFWDGLYAIGMKEIMVKHYIDGAINWVGYLNTEMVRESYSDESNYPFQITGNDGFALLDRMRFQQLDGNKYSGIKSKIEIINICIDRLGLPYTEIRVSLATTFAEFSGSATSTILHESYLDCANFYNEDGEAESMRVVLEGVLKPYGAFITAEKGNIYITDIDTLATSSTITYKCFAIGSLAFQASRAIANSLTVESVGYNGSGAEKEKSGGKNKQVVSYSPYPVKELVPKCVSVDSEFTTVPASYSTKNGYNYKTLSGHINFQESAPATFEQSYYGDANDTQVYLRWAKQSTHSRVLQNITPGFYVISGGDVITIPGSTRKKYVGATLRLSGDVMLVTKTNPYDSTTGSEYFDVSLTLGMKIGISVTQTYQYWLIKGGQVNISDTFQPFTIDVKITSDVSGVLLLDLYTNVSTLSRNGEDATPDNMREIWLKNLAVDLIDGETGAPIKDEDVEYIGYLDKAYKDEAERVDLICGTDFYRADRGKIMRKYTQNLIDYYAGIKQWTRKGQTRKIEELLLNSLSSNNRAGYITLNSMKLKNNFSHLNILTDGLIADKKFMVKSLRRDYYSNTNECSLVEISPDELTIV